MKKIVLYLIALLISCTNIEQPENDINQIPPNSIYQEGDVVYKIDTLFTTKYTINTHGDIEIIFREKYMKIIIINKLNSPIPYENNVKYCGIVAINNQNFTKYCIDFIEFKEGDDTFFISEKTIYYSLFGSSAMLNVNEIIRY